MLLVKSLLDKSILKYLLVGGLNTLFGLTMIFLAKFFGADDVLANLFGYSCGLLLSFKLNSDWTFRYAGNLLPAFYKFIVVVIFAYLLNLTIVLVVLNYFEINSYAAQATGIIPYTIASYLGSKYYAFTSIDTTSHS